MHFEGVKELPLPPAAVFAKLSDARFLVECVPGREATGTVDARQAVLTQKPGLAFIRGTLEVTIRVVEANPETGIRYAMSSKGIGSTSEVETTVTLTPGGAGTQAAWRTQIKSLGGLLKMVPAGLIRGAAQKMIADVWQEVEKRLPS